MKYCLTCKAYRETRNAPISGYLGTGHIEVCSVCGKPTR